MDAFFVNLFGGSCIVLFLVSSSYHLFSCHSPEAMVCFARMDFAGIAIGIVCSLLPGIYFALSCFNIFRWINMAIVLLFLIFASLFLLVPALAKPEYKFCKCS